MEERWLLVFSTLCFLGGFLRVLIDFYRQEARHRKTLFFATLFGFLFQCAFLSVRGQIHGRCPMTNLFEVVIFLCWSVSLLYFLVGPTFRVSLLGFFTSPLLFVLQTLALWFLPDPVSPKKLIDPWLETHAAISLLSYGAFGLSTVAAVMWLIQNRMLKTHRLGRLFRQMPPIQSLHRTLIRLLILGLILLSFGLMTAFKLPVWPGGAKLTISFMIWLFYAILMVLEISGKISPRQLSFATIIGYFLPVLTLAIVTRSPL